MGEALTRVLGVVTIAVSIALLGMLWIGMQPKEDATAWAISVLMSIPCLALIWLGLVLLGWLVP